MNWLRGVLRGLRALLNGSTSIAPLLQEIVDQGYEVRISKYSGSICVLGLYEDDKLRWSVTSQGAPLAVLLAYNKVTGNVSAPKQVLPANGSS